MAVWDACDYGVQIPQSCVEGSAAKILFYEARVVDRCSCWLLSVVALVSSMAVPVHSSDRRAEAVLAKAFF